MRETRPDPAPATPPGGHGTTSEPDARSAGPPVGHLTEAFEYTVETVGAEVAARVVGVSWREGCPVPLEDLRYLRLRHWDFDGVARTGEMMVHRDAADDVVAIFGELFDAGFPIRRMQLVDDFGADDDASMAADNTSAFNCRFVSGTNRWSQHAFGRAIDINPFENPYVSASGVVSPRGAESYADRSVVRPGMILEGDAVVRAFDRRGWDWGGRWSTPLDYQHFSATGG